jgi:predicted phage terminase large subunit-like protein
VPDSYRAPKGTIDAFRDALLSRIQIPTDELSRAGLTGPELAREDFLEFCQLMDSSYENAPHTQVIREQLVLAERGDIRRLIVTMPPRHGKSHHCSELFPAWALGRNPRRELVIASHTDKLAERKSEIVQSMLDSPVWPWPHVGIDYKHRGKQLWLTKDGGQVLACGVRGSPVGFGADILIIDDYHRHRMDADSPPIRDSVWSFWQEAGRTRLSPKGVVIILATRWHEDDLIGRLLNSAGASDWTLIDLPAIYDDPTKPDPLGRELGESLWPTRWPVEALPSVDREDIDRRGWEAQYQQRPTATEGNMFHRDWWERYHLDAMMARGLRPKFITVDSAFKTGVANDFSVAAVWGFYEGKAYLMDLWRARVEFPELETGLRDLYDKWHVPIYIEDKASGQSAIQTLARAIPKTEYANARPAVPVLPWKSPRGSNTRSRADEVTKWVAAHVVYVPFADWAQDYIEELASYPAVSHDDQVDVTSMALIELFKGYERPNPGEFGYNPHEVGQKTVGKWRKAQRAQRRQLAETRMKEALEKAGIGY